MPPSPPPALAEQAIVCSVAAAARYSIPAELLLAIAEKEAGRPGLRIRNRNGTEDYGPLQFNSGYIASLAGHGITPSDVLASGCYPYHLAAWRLHGHLTRDAGEFWARAANYHSRTPHLNATYRTDLIVRATRWQAWLAANQGQVLGTQESRSGASAQSYLPRTISATIGQ